MHIEKWNGYDMDNPLLKYLAFVKTVEKGLGVSILPDMILRSIPYRIEIRPLKEPYYRSIGLAMKSRERLTPAADRFLQYLPFRGTAE